MKKVQSIYSIFNAYFALCLFAFTKKKDNVWLIGGHNGQLYTDNAKVFYEYIIENHPNIKIYWIVDKNSPALKQIKSRKIIKGSIKSYLFFYQAEVVLFSDTLNSDIAPLSFVLPIIKNYYAQKFKVYLSHGTIAFKKMPQYTGKIAKIKREIFKSYNLSIASSELSKKAMIGYGIKPSSIIIAGSARNDVLYKIKGNTPNILIAPTWRPWLVSQPSLKRTDFYNYYSELLSNTNLIKYLYENKIMINFYLHHMFHKYLEEFKPFENDYIHILSPETNISNEIMSSDVMITDYSSICSDFYYLQKPILFFQFDKKQFIEKVGSEINLENTQFGEVSINTKLLVENLIKTIDNGNKVSPMQKEGEKYFIHFTDKQNCARIYNAIIENKE